MGALTWTNAIHFSHLLSKSDKTGSAMAALCITQQRAIIHQTAVLPEESEFGLCCFFLEIRFLFFVMSCFVFRLILNLKCFGIFVKNVHTCNKQKVSGGDIDLQPYSRVSRALLIFPSPWLLFHK